MCFMNCTSCFHLYLYFNVLCLLICTNICSLHVKTYLSIHQIVFLFRYYREGSHCEKCDQSCQLCTGPGPESCRVCSPPLLELQGTKLCVERCPNRFYQLNDVCTQCHTSCQTCTGTGERALYSFFP